MEIKNYFLPNVTKDSRDNVMYYDRTLKTTYRIPSKQEAKFALLKNRSLYILLFVLFLYNLEMKTSIVLLVGAGLFTLSSAALYFLLIPKFFPTTNFDVFNDRKNITQKDKVMRILMIVLYLVSMFMFLYIALTRGDVFYTIIAVFYVGYAIYHTLQNYFILKTQKN